MCAAATCFSTHSPRASTPLPSTAEVQLQQLQGLFPEIGRAWLTIDSKLYLWNFEDG